MTKVNPNNGNEIKLDIFPLWHIQIWHYIFFYQNILKYFNDFQNRNFSVLWLKWTQTNEMKQNQTFFHGTYSDLTTNLFSLKNIKVFQWLSKLKFLSFMTKVNLNNGVETKSDIFAWDVFRSGIIFHWLSNTKIFQWLL